MHLGVRVLKCGPKEPTVKCIYMQMISNITTTTTIVIVTVSSYLTFWNTE